MRAARSVDLAAILRNRPLACPAIDGHGRPALAVLITEVNQHRPGVVLDAHAVLRVALLVEPSDDPSTRVHVAHKRSPAPSSRPGRPRSGYTARGTGSVHLNLSWARLVNGPDGLR